MGYVNLKNKKEKTIEVAIQKEREEQEKNTKEKTLKNFKKSVDKCRIRW